MELVYKLPCLQYKLPFVFFVFTNNNKDQLGWTDTTHNDMWQSRVEIEHYSVTYCDRIAAFEAL